MTLFQTAGRPLFCRGPNEGSTLISGNVQQSRREAWMMRRCFSTIILICLDVSEIPKKIGQINRERERQSEFSTVFSYPEGMRVVVAPRRIKHCSRSPNQRTLCKTRASHVKRKQSRARKGTTARSSTFSPIKLKAREDPPSHSTKRQTTVCYKRLPRSARSEVMKCDLFLNDPSISGACARA